MKEILVPKHPTKMLQDGMVLLCRC